jgi:hypothetical protein
MRNFSDKSRRENHNTHFMFNNLFSENRTVYKMWKNTVEPGKPQMTIWCMRIACWIPQTTNTHSEYVILIAFPLQQWLHERASMLHYTYIARIVTFTTGVRKKKKKLYEGCPESVRTSKIARHCVDLAGAASATL